MTITEFEHLISEYGKPLYGFIRKMTEQPADADDLYQQTFLKAFEKLDTIEEEQNPKAFLISIAVGLYRNQYHKNKRREQIAPSFAITDENEELIPSSIDTESNLIQQEEKVLVNRCINQLNEKFRVPLLLYYQSDFSIDEIAGILKKPSGTIKTRLKKARELMKKELEANGYER